MADGIGSLNPCLRAFWTTPARYRVLHGGRGSSKSWDAAGFALFLAQKCKIRVLCTRQFQNNIEESVYTLLKMRIDHFRLQDKFTVYKNKIICNTTGSEFIFYGIARNIGEIKSTEGVDIHWCEEAHLLSEEQWETIEATIRKQGSQHWIIFNPRLSTDFVYKRFVINRLPKSVVRQINYNENPFLSQTMLDVIQAKKEEDEEEWRHIYLGEPRMDDDQAIIKRSWLMSAIDGHKKLGIEITGSKRIGFDVADSGNDKCAMVLSHGILTYGCEEWKGLEDELLKSCTRVWHKARETGSKVIYDAIGVGAGAGAKFNELNESHRPAVEHEKFFAGGAVFKPDSYYDPVAKIRNKDYFSNIKAQVWWLVADRLRNVHNAIRDGKKFEYDDMLFLDANTPKLTELIDELSTPKRDFDLAGRVKVESKKDLDKRDIPSPNKADSYIMANLPVQMNRGSLFG